MKIIKYTYSNLLLIMCFLSVAGLKLNAQTSDKKPNIIIILADDLGWGDVGFHGSEIMTPNLDKLAGEGVILNHFYTAPVCSPTRAGIMTGRYPDRFGLRKTVIPPWSEFGVDLDEKFLPEYLEEAGYENRVALGKWHLGHAKKEFLPLERGFNHFYGHYNGAIDYFTHEREGELDWHNDWETSYDKGYSTDLITDEAVKCIKDYAGGSPFFMYVAYNAPHGPLQAKKEDLLLYGFDESKPTFGKKHGETSQGKGNNPRQTYSAMVTNMDRGIGRIMSTLKNLNIEDNTLVLFFSDNGAAPDGGGSSGSLRGHKFQEWEGGVRAPAIIKWPDGFKGGRKLDQVTGYIDLIPTLINASGAGKSEHLSFDGMDILPVLKGEKDAFQRNFYLGYGSMVNGKWKVIQADAGNPKMKQKEDVLFEIMKDPNETTDVKDRYPEEFREMIEDTKVFDTIKAPKEVPPYGQGRKNFKAPKDWEITED